MISWAHKRQLLYFLLTLGVVLLIAAYPLFSFVYQPPTCYDNKQNQDEVGVDCGGSCPGLCETQVAPLHVAWQDAFPVGGGVYDLAALVENSNADAGIEHLYYTIRAYDSSGGVLAERHSATFANPSESFVIFEPSVKMSETPARVEITFDTPTWKAAKRNNEQIAIKNKQLTDPSGSPRLLATLQNNSPDVKRDVEAIALVYGKGGKIVAVSSTYLALLGRDQEQDVFFTWPHPISAVTQTTTCTAPVDFALVIDRSGSMDDISTNPPQPLTDAKDAAKLFIDAARPTDQISLVSFATFASIPIDQELSSDHNEVKSAVDQVAIRTEGVQHTNLADAIDKATKELLSIRGRDNVKKAIILLTDGIASRPVDPMTGSEEGYPETVAAQKAAFAKQNNISVYVIGLGSEVNKPFLRDTIASKPEYYYAAVDSSELSSIYNELAKVVCAQEVFTTEIKVRSKDSSSF